MVTEAKDYKIVYHGNKKLTIGDLGADMTITNPVHAQGIVSIDAMENQSESESQYADDDVWAVTASAPVLQGSMALMQVDDDVRKGWFGQAEVAATMGGVSLTGHADTGNYPAKAVEYLSEGIATSKIDGSVVAAAMLTVYPNLQLTSTPTKESETDTDGLSVINWTANIQATVTERFVINGKKVPAVEIAVIGDDEVAKVKADMDAGKFPDFSTTHQTTKG